MSTFEQLKCEDNLQDIIKAAFDADLNISGAWGYTQDLATIIHTSDAPLSQLEHMLASMRTYVEMNMTIEKEERFGSISLNETNRTQVEKASLFYDKVTYEITAMKETTYNDFIKAYKEGYGTEGFDMTKHFEERKKATLTREEVYWFEIHQTRT